MIRLIEIYSRLEAVDGFLALMLQQPENYRERIIHDRIVGSLSTLIALTPRYGGSRDRVSFVILTPATYCQPFLKFGCR